jgi:hypothetical protein
MTNKEKFEQVFGEDIIKLWYKPASLFVSWCAEDYDDTEPVRESVRISIDYDRLERSIRDAVRQALKLEIDDSEV